MSGITALALPAYVQVEGTVLERLLEIVISIRGGTPMSQTILMSAPSSSKERHFEYAYDESAHR